MTLIENIVHEREDKSVRKGCWPRTTPCCVNLNVESELRAIALLHKRTKRERRRGEEQEEKVV